jgi:hypothetical protein
LRCSLVGRTHKKVERKKNKNEKILSQQPCDAIGKVSSPTALIPQLLAKDGAVKTKKRLCQQLHL